MKWRKGQAGIEFIAKYILVVMVLILVAVVFVELKILKPTPPTGMLGFTRVIPLDFGAKTDNTLTLVLSNHAKQAVILENISVMANERACIALIPSNVRLEYETPYKAVLNCNFSGYEVGDGYNANVSITYKDEILRVSMKSNGRVFGALEEGLPPEKTFRGTNYTFQIGLDQQYVSVSLYTDLNETTGFSPTKTKYNVGGSVKFNVIFIDYSGFQYGKVYRYNFEKVNATSSSFVYADRNITFVVYP